jgi:hypothetical protein
MSIGGEPTMLEGFWRVRIGRLTVYDFELEEALACAMRVKRYQREMAR